MSNSPAASPEISHRTVWRTWLFIAYSDERCDTTNYQFIPSGQKAYVSGSGSRFMRSMYAGTHFTDLVRMES